MRATAKDRSSTHLTSLDAEFGPPRYFGKEFELENQAVFHPTGRLTQMALRHEQKVEGENNFQSKKKKSISE